MIGFGEQHIERTHRDLCVPWMASGAIAVIVRGVRRFASDIDAAIRGAEHHAAINGGWR